MENQLKTQISISEWLIFTILVVLSLGEGLTCYVVKTKKTFTFFYQVSLVLFALTIFTTVAFIIIAVYRKVKGLDEDSEDEKDDTILSRNNPIFWIIITILSVVAIVASNLFEKNIGDDLTIEYMHICKDATELFGLNPMTGQAMEQGIYPLYKFNALPYMYGVIARFLNMNPTQLVLYIIPVVVLIGYLLLGYKLGQLLFDYRKGRSAFFLLLILVLLVTGDRWKLTPSYGVLHEGWKGNVIFGVIVIPFIMLLAIRAIRYKQFAYALLGVIVAGGATLFCHRLEIPTLWFANRGAYGHQLGFYFGELFLLICLRAKHNIERIHDGWILVVFSLLMVFPYNGLMYPAIAYVYCRLLDEIGKYIDKKVIVVGGLVTICFAGTILPGRSNLPLIKKDIPINQIYEASRMLKNPVLAADNETLEKARIYTGIKTTYGKSLWIEGCGLEVADILSEEPRILYESFNAYEKDARLIGLLSKSAGCNILLAKDELFALTDQEAYEQMDSEEKREDQIDALTSQGWEIYTEGQGYILFVRK